MLLMKNVRTRFAPSPTGYMHVGGVRTALFAWLVARQNNGQFILRLEDTDKNRQVSGSEDHIIKSLDWLGLDRDEGFQKGGNFGPYRQSDRLGIYRKWAQKLIDSGRAYADPYSQEELQQFRAQAQKDKQPFLFRNHRPKNPPKWDGSKPLRFKSGPKAYKWNDLIMGDLATGPEVIDDFILIKSDGYPTYNFAHIVDDAEMKISHIIRGQEFISSMPNYLNLYEALGLTPPVFATVPHILKPTGNKKLSKRDGAKDILDYRDEGYLPEAIINFLASLGWNDGSEKEIFTIDELVRTFSLDRVQKGGARFDEQKLLWLNGHYVRDLSPDELYKKSENYWPKTASTATDNYKKQVLGLIQERLKYFDEIPELTEFFFAENPFTPELITENKKLNKVPKTELASMLKLAEKSLAKSDFSVANLQKKLNDLLEKTEQKPVILFSLIRIAITMAPASPGLADTLHVLGKNVSLARISSTYDKIGSI